MDGRCRVGGAPQVNPYAYLAPTVATTILVILIASAVWFASVSAHAPSFVGAAQPAVMAAFMLAGTAPAASGTINSLRA